MDWLVPVRSLYVVELLLCLVAVEVRKTQCATTETIECSSKSYQLSTCSLTSSYGVATSVRVIEQQSDSSCDLDRTFGLTPDLSAIWVDSGCRAVFKVTFYEETTTTSTSTSTAATTSVTTSTITSTSAKTTETDTTTNNSSTVLTFTSSPATTSTTQLTSVTSEAPSVTSRSPSMTSCSHSRCRCVVRTNVAHSNVTETLQQLKTELTVNATGLSSYRRRKESATDPRWSAQVTGASGVLIAAVLWMIVPALDARRLYLWYDKLSK